jgi:hypothetical protein
MNNGSAENIQNQSLLIRVNLLLNNFLLATEAQSSRRDFSGSRGGAEAQSSQSSG